MIDLRECTTLQIMPEILRKDAYVQAASYALQKTAEMIMEKIDRTSAYAEIDRMPEKIVDLAAVEFRSKYYGSWMSASEKREAVKKTLPWYYRAGTLLTVQELTDFVFQDAKVEEWFQYGSSAFLFRILIQVISQDISLEKYMEFLQSLYEVKNTRSHLEAIIFEYHKRTEIKAVAAGGTGSGIKVKTRTVKRIRAVPAGRNIAALFVNQNIRVHADNSIKEDEVYLLSEDGTKKRVLDENGYIVKIREGV